MKSHTLEKNSPTPLHIQLYDILKQKIKDGDFVENQLIPSENEISKMYDISRTTVRNVILRLVNEQLIYRVAGKGTFVCEQKIIASGISQKGIREQLEEMGYATSTKLIEKKLVSPTKSLSSLLMLPPDEMLIMIKRLRYINNKPFSILTNYLSYSRFEGILNNDNDIDIPLCDTLANDYGIKAKYAEETLESVLSNPSESKLLSVPNDFHVLLTECVLYDDQNIPYEVSNVIFRGDIIKLKFKFNRT